MAQVLPCPVGHFPIAHLSGYTALESRHREAAQCSAKAPQVRRIVRLPNSRRRMSHFLQSPEQFAVAAQSYTQRVAGPVTVVSSLAEKESTAVRSPVSRTPRSVIYKATVVTVRKNNPDFLGDLLKSSADALRDELTDRMDALMDVIGDALGNRVVLGLVSEEIDPQTGVGKLSKPTYITDWAEKASTSGPEVVYTAQFEVDSDFGHPGAVTVVNNHGEDLYIKTISLTESGTSKTIHFPCDSFVDAFKETREQRIFFRNKAYLPGDTPPGLVDLREKQLAGLRGDGTGVRKLSDRIYDYDVYNDYGDGDAAENLVRPVLGGSDLPYPRRCRTGRPPSTKDPSKESRLPATANLYVPRDQAFEDAKQADFVTGSLRNLVLQKFPAFIHRNTDTPVEFDAFDDIDDLYKYKEQVPNLGFLDKVMNTLSSIFTISGEKVMSSWLRFSSPLVLEGDKFRWIRDDEFGRQILAGVNPVVVERLKVFPPESSLDPSVYGRKESALTEEHLKTNLEGLTVKEAIEQNRLYIIDYHDTFLPFINLVNSKKDRKAYAARAVFFYDAAGIFRPLAIELSLPPPEAGTEGTKQVFTPGSDATSSWLWILAKAHFSAVDAGFHQLSTHWLRTHACTEPYILATYRHLSDLHPIAKLLQPHFRYTLEINAAARQRLINAGGVIELTFSPGEYSFQISAAAYKLIWRFDKENLPDDLIRRGMAEKTPGGLKLVIEDYPYAADGLLIWDALKSWITEYVSLYYVEAAQVIRDTELQAWWKEIRTVGHADKQAETWWPELRSKEALVDILTTMIWVSSAQHAAVNFGQYAYGGYVPNRPTLARRLIPQQHEPEFEEFLKGPEKFLLSVLPNQAEATNLMSTVGLLSTHSRDEEYIGHRRENWTDDERALGLSDRFASAVRGIEDEINKRNNDPSLKLRNGAGVIPYELLHPRSLVIDSDGKEHVTPGITSRGVPNSISI